MTMFFFNNTIGTKVHLHKLAMFYFTIQKLLPHLNNFFGGVHVAMIAYSAHIAKYRIVSVLKRFMDDLKKLEMDEGVSFDVGNQVVVFTASLVCVSADTLTVY